MQNTIRRIPKEVDRELRLRARREGKSLNEVAVEALAAATGAITRVQYRDFSDLVGSWVHDEETERVLVARPGVRVLWPGDVTTRIYASIYRQLRNDGFPIPANDIWIAALSLENEAALVTRDPHFRKIPELLVIGPN